MVVTASQLTSNLTVYPKAYLANNKENIKHLITGLLEWESTSDRLQRANNRESVSMHDVIILRCLLWEKRTGEWTLPIAAWGIQLTTVGTWTHTDNCTPRRHPLMSGLHRGIALQRISGKCCMVPSLTFRAETTRFLGSGSISCLYDDPVPSVVRS